jgi:hypothetical protein
MPDPSSSIEITLPGGDSVHAPLRTPVRDVLPTRTDPDTGLPWLGALVNNDVCSLDYPLPMNCAVKPVCFLDRHGSRIYRRTLSFLLAKAAHTCFPDAAFAIEHSLGNA